MVTTEELAPGDRQAAERVAVEAPEELLPEELFRRYHRPIRAFFLSRGFSAEESRDLAQETFLRVYKSKEAFRGESKPATWLFQIAANLYKNTVRSRSARKREGHEVPLETPDGQEILGDPVQEVEDDGPLAAMLTEERLRILREAFEDLPPQMRRVVVLRVDQDLKYREIAELLRVSIETVKAHLYQARQHLRDKLADYFTDIEL
jgi:RNA polymerase sigma-70 factor (ECF subfamily)